MTFASSGSLSASNIISEVGAVTSASISISHQVVRWISAQTGYGAVDFNNLHNKSYSTMFGNTGAMGKGYACGGINSVPATSAAIFSLAYATETTATTTVTGTANSTRLGGAGFNSATAGYLLGGYSNGSQTTYNSTLNKFAFSTGSASLTGTSVTNLADPVFGTTIANTDLGGNKFLSTLKAYTRYADTTNRTSGQELSTIEFSTDTFNIISWAAVNSTHARIRFSAPTYGFSIPYLMRGYDVQNNIYVYTQYRGDMYKFATGTMGDWGATLNGVSTYPLGTALRDYDYPGGALNSIHAGYLFLNGSCEKYNFYSFTISTPGSGSWAADKCYGAKYNSPAAGYLAGGSSTANLTPPAYTSATATIYKLNYSTETYSALSATIAGARIYPQGFNSAGMP